MLAQSARLSRNVQKPNRKHGRNDRKSDLSQEKKWMRVGSMNYENKNAEREEVNLCTTTDVEIERQGKKIISNVE